MSAIIDSNPAYQAITLMRVDWDQHGDGDLVQELGVPRRSTLVMFKGGQEIARVVSQTSVEQIQPMFDAAIGS